MNKLVVMIVAGAAAGAVFPPAAQAQAQPNSWFRQLDRNRDGYLQRVEVAKLPGIPHAFDEADANHDGKLDPGEFAVAEGIRQSAKLPALPQDTSITQKVTTAIERDPELKELALQVKTHRGRVTLSGAVQDENQRALALKSAAAVEGVTAVGDALKLR